MSLTPLNEDLDIIQNLVIPSMEDDLDIIQKLDDEPNDVGGLSAAELKFEFDRAGNTIKKYINETFVPALSDTVAEAEERAKAEAERIANEEGRGAAEQARVEAEQARAAVEASRVLAEEERKTAEAARKEAEAARVREEQARVDRDTGIVAQATEQANLAAASEKAAAQSVLDAQNEVKNAQTEVQNAKDEVANAQKEVQNAQGKVEDAEAWARGTRNGEPVSESDPAYANNSKYWAENAKEIVGPTVTPAQLEEVVAEINQSISDTNAAIEETNTALEKVSSGSTSVPIPNAIAQKMGLSTPATINDALSVLGDVGNVHVWKRDTIYEEAVPAGYTLGSAAKVYFHVGPSANGSTYGTYGDSISVSGNGTVSDAFTLTLSVSYNEYTNANKVVGKFIKTSTSIASTWQESGRYYFIPETATVVRRTEVKDGTTYYVVYTNAAQLVTGYPEIPAGTVTDYPTSTDRNAFGEGLTDIIPAGYTLGTAKRMIIHGIASATGNLKGTGTLSYSDSVSVTADGSVSLANPQTVEVGYYEQENESVLLGKFVESAFSEDGQQGDIFFIPSDAVRNTGIQRFDSTQYNFSYFSNAQPVIGYPETGSAYLTYLGALGDKARIETGSYVGTGNYDVSLNVNENTKFVVIANDSGAIMAFFTPLNAEFSSFAVKSIYNSTCSYFTARKSGGTLSWSGSYSNNNSVKIYLCEAGTTFYVFTIS